MKRYYREDDGSLWDRRLQRYTRHKTERTVGNHYVLDEGTENERWIPRDDVEEVK